MAVGMNKTESDGVHGSGNDTEVLKVNSLSPKNGSRKK